MKLILSAFLAILILSAGGQSFNHTQTESAAFAGFAPAGSFADSALELNRTYGGAGSDFALALVQTVDGGYALAGRTYSFGAGSSDIWLVRTDAFGNHLWNKTFGGPRDDRTSSLVQTGDGGFAIAGTTYSFGAGSSDIWLVKTDANGNPLWNKTYGGPREDDPAHFVVQTADGGYALAGRTYSFGAGSSDIWLVRTDAFGNHLWNRTYGGTNVDGAFAFGQTADGGYALAGYTNSFGAGSYDFWLVKTDSAGNMVWNRTYGGTNEDWAYALIQTGDGGYAMAGETGSFGAGNGDVWLVKTDALGNYLWNRTYGGPNVDGVFALVHTVEGGFALAGHTYSFGAGSCDAWLVKTSADGRHEWNETVGGVAEDFGCRVTQTTDGAYVLAGSTTSYGAGSDDFWLVKTDGGASTIIVPDEYSTIQQAVNSASDGDVIFVRNGTYYEHVVVNKTVALRGEDASMTIVDGSGTGNVIAVAKDGVTIAGFTIQNSGAILGNAGLWLNNVNLCSISGNKIRDNFAGLWLDGASGNLITANEITANVDDGIVFNYSHNNTISENHIALHEYFGIVMNWSHNNTISGNNVTQTTGPSHGDGINLWRSSDNRILQNHVYDNNRYGIRLEVESNTNTVAGNHIDHCLTGLQVYNYSSHNTLRDNHVANCSTGIELTRLVTHTTLTNNTIENTGTAINLNTWTTNTTITRNHLAHNTAGLQFTYANQNEVSLNNVTGNDIGASVQYSQNNLFHSNNFTNNTQHALVSAGYTNVWDSGYPRGGNYWSGYTDVDSYKGTSQNVVGSDGVWDHPYIINAANQDRYPLAQALEASPRGDVDGDRDVDIFDIVRMAAVYGVKYPAASYDRQCDLDLDGDIDLFDVVRAAVHYGTSW